MFTVTHQFISEGIAEVILLITSLYLRELLRSVHHSPVYNWGNCRGLSLTSLSLRESPVYIWGNCWGQSITHQSISEGTAEVYHSPVYLWGNRRGLSRSNSPADFPSARNGTADVWGAHGHLQPGFLTEYYTRKKEASQPSEQVTKLWSLKTVSLRMCVIGHCYPILLPCSGCTEPDRVHHLQIVPNNTATNEQVYSDCTAAPSRRA